MDDEVILKSSEERNDMERLIVTIETMEELDMINLLPLSKTLVTHSGAFHAHDVMCALGFQTIIRTRNHEIIEYLISLGVQAWDVGDSKRIKNPKANDHHHDGYKPTMETMFPEKLLSRAEDSLELTMILRSIMDLDNGIEHRDYVSGLISSFNPCWNESSTSEAYDIAFQRAVKFTEMVARFPENFINLQAREEARNSGKSLATEIATRACDEQAGECFLVLPRFVPWQEVVVSFNSTHLAAYAWVLFPSEDGQWRIQAVPKTANSFEFIKAVQAETTDEGFVFCHPNKFICGYKTREQAIKAVQSWV
jgi:uncharacterized UPF0160 family protein